MLAMADAAYLSRVRIERLGGPQRLAWLPAEEEPVTFGVWPPTPTLEAPLLSR